MEIKTILKLMKHLINLKFKPKKIREKIDKSIRMAENDKKQASVKPKAKTDINSKRSSLSQESKP